MSQNIDLSGPVSAEALRIADRLLNELLGPIALHATDVQQGKDEVARRVQLIGEMANVLLLSFSVAAQNVAARRMNDALDQDEAGPSEAP